MRCAIRCAIAPYGLRSFDLSLPDGQISKILSSPLCKNIFVFVRPKSVHLFAPSRPTEGRSRDRHGRGTGCGGHRWRRRRPALEVDGEVVWSWRSDAGVKLAGKPPTTVATKHGHRGEHEGNR